MSVTRLVIGAASAGGVTASISGNKLTFPAVYGGPPSGFYDFAYNIPKDEYKALTDITPHPNFFNALSDVTVDNIGTWTEADKFALTRTALASPTFATYQAAFSAVAANDEEIVVLPLGDNSFGLLPVLFTTGSTFNAKLRGWSPQQKIIGLGSEWAILHNADLKIEDFILYLGQSNGLSPRTSAVMNRTWEFNRVQIISANGRGFFIGNNQASGFVLTCNSCIATCSSGLAKDAFRIDDLDATLICHNCIGAGSRPYRRLGGTFKVFNCLAHSLPVNNNSSLQFDGAFDAASDFNAAQNATAPGASSLQNQTLAQLGMAWLNSPAGINSQYPIDFRTVNSPGSNMKDNGFTFADSPRYDFNGFKCPTLTGSVRTIGASNFSPNNSGVEWPGFAPILDTTPPGKPAGVSVS